MAHTYLGNGPHSKRSYISTAAFNVDIFAYEKQMNSTTFKTEGHLVAATLPSGAALTAALCPAGRILREAGRKLFPGTHPGLVATDTWNNAAVGSNTSYTGHMMVLVFDAVTGLKGYIDPNNEIFAVYNSDRANDFVDATENPSTGGAPTRLGQSLYTAGNVVFAPVAMGLDSGSMNLDTKFDARGSLRYGKFTIHDYHAQNRMLSIPEIFTYSSNIGTAKLALSLGVDYHKAFLKKMGQLDRLRTELPESAEPIVPKNWGEISTVTIAFGHGLSIAPLQAVMGVAATLNGGLLIPPTFLKRSEEEVKAVAKQVLKPETSIKMRYLMRLNAEVGSAKEANVKGYFIGGKTGTAEKVVNGRYSKTKLLTDFMAVLPADKPRYLLLVMLDEPQATKETRGYATAGWNAGPTAARVIERVAPLLNIQPRFDLPKAEQMLLVSNKVTR